MTCTLTVSFFYNGAVREVVNYSVPDGSYVSPYKVNRPDLGYDGISNKVYSVDCAGTQGVIRLGTYYPNSVDVSITSAVNSCPPPAVSYDCINGACIPKTTYNTPGIYNSLEDCETSCGTGCSGKCIPNSEWATIEGLSSQLKQRNCS